MTALPVCSESKKTMNLILEILAGLVLISAIIWVSLRKKRTVVKTDNSPQARLDRAVWAWARVLKSSHDEPGLAGMVRVTLELEVHLPGTPAYTIDTVWLVEQESLEYVQVDQEVPLKVDPLGMHHVYPNGPWAKLAGKG